MGRDVRIAADAAADVSDAKLAIGRLNASTAQVRGYEAVAHLLLRAEAVASSRIEGLEIGGHRLARADAARAADGSTPHGGAAEVLGTTARRTTRTAASTTGSRPSRRRHARRASGSGNSPSG